MGYTGSAPNQTYQRTDGVRTGSAVNVTADGLGVNNTAALADARENDLAAAINLLWLRNGGNQPTANLPMNSKKFTGMAQGSERADSIRLDQVQDGDLIYASVGGTANAIELTLTPTTSASVEGQAIIFIPASDSTSSVTVDVDGIGAVALQYNGAALVGGELQAGLPAIIVNDGTVWQLVNIHLLPRLANTANGLGASLIGIEDAAGNFAATTVEAVLAEIIADYAATSNGNGASKIGIEDSGGLITATTVEGALAENRTAIDTAEAAIAAIEADYLTSSDIGSTVQPLDELLTEIAALSTDPNADSGLFFDDSAGAMAFWTPTGALSFSGTNLVFNSPVPTIQRFTSGSGTYTPTAGTSYIRVRMVGGGGGGGAAATNAGSSGSATSFDSWTADNGNGGGSGSGGAGGDGGSGGANGTGTLVVRLSGKKGGSGAAGLAFGGAGAGSYFSGGGELNIGAGAGTPGVTSSGSGGSGGVSTNGGGGGGAGEYVEFFVTNPSAVSYEVGSGGAGGAAGTQPGGDGAAGLIIVEEYA